MEDEKLYNVYGIIHTEDGEENPKSKYDDSYYVRADHDAGPFMRKAEA